MHHEEDLAPAGCSRGDGLAVRAGRHGAVLWGRHSNRYSDGHSYGNRYSHDYCHDYCHGHSHGNRYCYGHRTA